MKGVKDGFKKVRTILTSAGGGTPLRLRWQVDEGKFLSESEVSRLRKVLTQRSNYALKNGNKVPVNDWLVIDLALSTGLRVSEIAGLRVGDIWADDGKASLIVRNGKGGKQRVVRFNDGFKEHLKEYLEWKKKNGSDCGPESPLIRSSNTMGKMTTRALQKAFERNANRSGIQGYSIHSLRHTYATFLLRASGNLRMVQKQLGHSSIKTTQVYADVFDEDLNQAVEKLYKPR